MRIRIKIEDLKTRKPANEFTTCELLDYRPDNSSPMKFRGIVIVRMEDGSVRESRETCVHQDDWHVMNKFLRTKNDAELAYKRIHFTGLTLDEAYNRLRLRSGHVYEIVYNRFVIRTYRLNSCGYHRIFKTTPKRLARLRKLAKSGQFKVRRERGTETMVTWPHWPAQHFIEVNVVNTILG